MIHEMSADLIFRISWNEVKFLHKIPCDNKEDVFKALEKVYSGQWSYTITNEVRGDVNHILYVILYIPDHAPISIRHQIESADFHPEKTAIFDMLDSMGLLERSSNIKEPECVDFNKMTEEEYQKEIQKTAPVPASTSIQEVLEKDKETIMEHIKEEVKTSAPAALTPPPILNPNMNEPVKQVKKMQPIQYPVINTNIGSQESAENYLLRMTKEFENAFSVVRQQMPSQVFGDTVLIADPEVPNAIAAYVQAYVLNNTESQRAGFKNDESWISKKKIELGNDIAFEIAAEERGMWSHLTSQEIVLEKAIDHYYKDVPLEIVPAITRKQKIKSFCPLYFQNGTDEYVDRRLFVKLSILGLQPSLRCPFGTLGGNVTPEEDTPPFMENGLPTPPKKMTFSNPPDPNCPPELTKPVQTGWDSAQSINTQIETPDPLKYYTPPINKIPFVQTALNAQGVPINMYGYTELQMDRVQAFKEQFDASAEDVFNSYIKSWSNGQLQYKTDLTPTNIDQFLTWAESLKLGKPLWQ